MRRGDASKYKDYPELAKKQPVFTAINTPKAVRKWRCELCGKEIPVGARYLRYTNRVPFEIDDCAYHFQCFAIINDYCKKRHRKHYLNLTVRQWAKRNYCKCKKCNSCLGECKKIAKILKFRPPRFPLEK